MISSNPALHGPGKEKHPVLPGVGYNFSLGDGAANPGTVAQARVRGQTLALADLIKSF